MSTRFTAFGLARRLCSVAGQHRGFCGTLGPPIILLVPELTVLCIHASSLSELPAYSSCHCAVYSSYPVKPPRTLYHYIILHPNVCLGQKHHFSGEKAASSGQSTCLGSMLVIEYATPQSSCWRFAGSISDRLHEPHVVDLLSYAALCQIEGRHIPRSVGPDHIRLSFLKAYVTKVRASGMSCTVTSYHEP